MYTPCSDSPSRPQKLSLSVDRHKGVYPQSNRSLATVDIDASKGLIDQWEHFFVAIVAIHRNGFRWKKCFFGFD